jgi:uncharacterized membrane protein
MSSGADTSNPPPRAVTPLISAPRIIAALCVVAPFVAMLWIPTYNEKTPRLLGFPFFYWYQLLWVVITALLMVVAYFAVEHDRAARRAARDGAAAPAVPPARSAEDPARGEEGSQ